MRKLTREEYLANEAKFVADNNLKIGSKVRVKSILDLEPDRLWCGTRTSWVSSMNKYLGLEGTIESLNELTIKFSLDGHTYYLPYYMLESVTQEKEVSVAVDYTELTVDTLAPELLGILYSRGTNLDLIEKVTFTVVNGKETVCNIFFNHDILSPFTLNKDYIITGRSKLNKGEEYNSVIGNTLAFARALDA